jgi:hypothetical protein
LNGGSAVSQGRYLHRTTQTQNKHTQTCMPRIGLEPTIPVFERAKTVRASRGHCDRQNFLTLPGVELPPLGRPARNQSLYRLRYPGSDLVTRKIKTGESIHVGPNTDASWQLYWHLQLVCRQLLLSLSVTELTQPEPRAIYGPPCARRRATSSVYVCTQPGIRSPLVTVWRWTEAEMLHKPRCVSGLRCAGLHSFYFQEKKSDRTALLFSDFQLRWRYVTTSIAERAAFCKSTYILAWKLPSISCWINVCSSPRNMATVLHAVPFLVGNWICLYDELQGICCQFQSPLHMGAACGAWEVAKPTQTPCQHIGQWIQVSQHGVHKSVENQQSGHCSSEIFSLLHIYAHPNRRSQTVRSISCYNVCFLTQDVRKVLSYLVILQSRIDFQVGRGLLNFRLTSSLISPLHFK